MKLLVVFLCMLVGAFAAEKKAMKIKDGAVHAPEDALVSKSEEWDLESSFHWMQQKAWCCGGQSPDIWGVCTCAMYLGSWDSCQDWCLQQANSCKCNGSYKCGYLPEGEFSTGGCSISCVVTNRGCENVDYCF